MKQTIKSIHYENKLNMKFFVIAFFSLILCNGCAFNCLSYLNKSVRPVLIKGIVIGKEKEEIGCFGRIIYQKKGNIRDTVEGLCYCGGDNGGLWKYVEQSDSIIKESGSLKVIVSRNGVNKVFDYPCCSQ
jgi:hypothetical protein